MSPDPRARGRVLNAALGDPTPIPTGYLRPGSDEALAFALSEVERQRSAGRIAAAAPPVVDLARIAAMNSRSHPNFRLRGLADRLGVELGRVEGTGAGGSITRSDIQASAEAMKERMANIAASSPSVGGTSAFGPNPLVARARAQDPGWAAAAAAKAPAPTMFAGGDLPPWTASGLDPALLTRLPWNARHTAAAMPSQADAYGILQAFDGIGSDDAEAEAAEWGFAEHPGCQRYEQAVQAWLLDAVTKEQQDAALFGSSNDQKAMYALLFGDR